MSYTVIESTGRGREWLQARTAFVTASEAPIIANLSPYMTQRELWQVKTSGIVTDDDIDLFFFAHELEAPIARRAAAKWPEEFGRMVDSPGLIRWDENPHIAATPDYLVEHGDAGAVTFQIKTVGPYMRHKWGDALEQTDVPDDYRIQVIIENAVLGKPYGFVEPLFGLNDLVKPIRIDTDLEFLEWYVNLSAEWYQRHIVEGVEPAVMLGDDLIEFWPGNAGEVARATADIARMAREGKRYRDIERKDAEDADETRKFRISEFMGNATELFEVDEDGNDGEMLVTWRPKKSPAVFDLASLRADHPDLVDAYTREGKPQRTMLFKPTRQSKVELAEHKVARETAAHRAQLDALGD